ncbi:cbb3-type cytochrome oxidase assembly protein CcoS [Thauera mechernichensis]|uniref:Cbb3-type cytochrome oxidase assembly protein CcoS n=1 Tax=Thauera mechernichensis TaxID=82788 RepID=A0ABW3WH59_9RHOO|nr:MULTISPECIES: cbb3-type cytochrome oxidase assembly protein CcoS [Thauera]ENO81634.1 cytochrome oxidase maturation protein, cbb3-type [Thauera sp. 27]ENO94303.1 cytochrome oxidase maturation protein, cbb3-type [Thauera sp. 28]MDG3063152.1 cbb3-type cytochrome oxidase assembly protein CcoS [Thauera mechernichensis]WBL63197.1 cbb3-type cytochrome oxidase assembly protein CcoS [Thauera sp. WB-2]HAG75519.1 cbb3-type cytochrome oxidase assembly protein CcoS [Thauera sp.]
MESLYLLIPLSVLLVFVIGVIFWWSLRSGQYDDMEGPAYRLLMDDRDEPAPDAREREGGDAKRTAGRDEGER